MNTASKAISYQGAYKVMNGTYYDYRTIDDLIILLEGLRLCRTRVLVVYGNTHTGVPWEVAFAERGRIGRSTGEHKIPLLVKTRRSLGGESLLSEVILQVRESRGSRILWSHPNIPRGVKL